jgi:hypothetical protein
MGDTLSTSTTNTTYPTSSTASDTSATKDTSCEPATGTAIEIAATAAMAEPTGPKSPEHPASADAECAISITERSAWREAAHGCASECWTYALAAATTNSKTCAGLAISTAAPSIQLASSTPTTTASPHPTSAAGSTAPAYCGLTKPPSRSNGHRRAAAAPSEMACRTTAAPAGRTTPLSCGIARSCCSAEALQLAICSSTTTSSYSGAHDKTCCSWHTLGSTTDQYNPDPSPNAYPTYPYDYYSRSRY